MSDGNKIWVTGLNGEAADEAPPGHEGRPPPKGLDWGLLAAIAVGVGVGGGLWFALLRPTALQPEHYSVQSGDTLWHIATDHGVTVDELRSWNELTGDRIDVGDDLLIFPTGAHASGGAGSQTASRSHKGRGGKRARGPSGKLGPTTSPTSGSLHLPPEQACLAGPDFDALDLSAQGNPELSVAASAGLSYGQTKAAMDAFLPELVRCLPDGGAVGTATLDLTVACSGRMASVTLVDGGDLPAPLLDCVQQTLGFAAFPAHDMPDGFSFTYPLTFSMGD